MLGVLGELFGLLCDGSGDSILLLIHQMLMLDGSGFLDGLLVFLGRVNATEDIDPSRGDFFELLDVATSSNGMPQRLGVIPLPPLLVTKSCI